MSVLLPHSAHLSVSLHWLAEAKQWGLGSPGLCTPRPRVTRQMRLVLSNTEVSAGLSWCPCPGPERSCMAPGSLGAASLSLSPQDMHSADMRHKLRAALWT